MPCLCLGGASDDSPKTKKKTVATSKPAPCRVLPEPRDSESEPLSEKAQIESASEAARARLAKDSPNDYIRTYYQMGRTLGKGGSCRVVVATSKKTSEEYALKIMSMREKMNRELFEKEKNILKRLDHPNIINFVEDHQDDESYYIVSELCRGGELFDRIVDKNNPITEKRAAELVRTMLKAIEHCHDKNIVHRDLKPENFVFKTKAQDSDMVLIDFGCAKLVEDDTEYKDLVGTPYYLAPESAAGHKYIRTGKVLKCSDVWSIGVIAFVLMTGRPPFNGHSNTEIFSSIIKKPLKFPATVKLSEHFITFVQKMLKKSPKRRLPLKDALKDQWVIGEKASANAISKDVIRVLRQFNQQTKLKKAITKTLASHMGHDPKQKIREHFQRLDKNNDGGLDEDELAFLLQDMGVTASEAKADARKIISSCDDDNSGQIEFAEFAQIWQRKLLSVNQSYIHAVFTVLDEDGNGQIDAHELQKVLELEMDEVKQIIEEVDTDGNGLLSFDEFKRAMNEKPLPGQSDARQGYKMTSEEINKANEGMGDVGKEWDEQDNDEKVQYDN